MLKTFTLLIFLLIFNTAHAEILKQDNQIISHHQIKLNDFIESTYLKKFENQYYLTMKLLHTLNKRGYVVTLEDSQIKLDNETLYRPVRTSEVYCGFRQKLAIKLSEEDLIKITNSAKVQIILPFYKNGTDYFTLYQPIDLTNQHLSEWKQIIIAK